MGLRAFRKIQVSNVEGTPGTAEAAVSICYGTMTTFESGEVIEYPDEDRASLARHMANDFVVGKEARLVWAGDLNFRDIAWALAMSLCGNITPTQPDAVNKPLGYLWTFTPGLTTANTPDITNGIDTFTFEYGDDTQAYEAEYCFGTRLVISGAPNKPVKFTCNISGRQQTDTSFTGALSAVAVQRAPFNLGGISIDADGGTMGATAQTSLLRAFTWELDTKFKAFYASDGALYFTGVDEDRKAPKLTLTYQWGSAADTERGFYEARTTRLVRLKINGATALNSGKSDPPYLYLDQAVRYTNWPTWGAENGRSTVQVTAEGVYNSTYAKVFEAALYTNLATYP